MTLCFRKENATELQKPAVQSSVFEFSRIFVPARMVPRTFPPPASAAGVTARRPHTSFMASTIIAAPASILAISCASEHSPLPASSRASGAFDADDLSDDGRPTWLHHLEQHGYAVIRNVASPAQVETARDMYWQFFTQHRGADRARPETWTRLAGRDPSGISFTDHALMQVLCSITPFPCSFDDT